MDANNNNSQSLYGWRKGGDHGLLGDSHTNNPPTTAPYVPYPSYFAEQLASKLLQPGGKWYRRQAIMINSILTR